MRRSFILPLSLVLSTGACAEAESTSTPDDAAVDYGQPVTTRPDDGVDTSSDAGVSPDADASDSTLSDTGSTDASDSGSTDSGSSEAASDVATGDGGSPSAARIHEIYSDRNFEGDKVEFVEIAAPAGTPLDTLFLRAFDNTGAVKWNLRVADAGVKMKSSGYWVVGTSWTGPDKTYSLSEWGLPNDGGSLQLNSVDGSTTTLLDVVGYGTAPTSTTAADPKKLVEGTAATLPAAGSTNKTIGRKSVPGDTDANATDFCVMTASPGAANNACL